MNAETQYELGMDCLDSERNDDALRHLDKALELDAACAPAYRGRAEVYERIGDYGNAVVNYERYYELVPEDLDPYKLGVSLFFYANTLQFMSDYHGALEKYRRSAELCGLVISYYRMGNMHEILGDLGAATTSYDRALGIDPRQSLRYAGKARIYRKTGAFIDAITSFEQLSMLHPKNALPYYYLGIMFYEQGHYRSAISCFGVAISADEVDEEKFNFPDVNPHCARGLAYLQRGEYMRAIADFDKAIRRGYGEAYADRGDARRRIGEYELAMDDYNQAIELNAGLAYAYLGRGELNLLIGENEKAQTAFDMAVNLDPERKYFEERRAGAHAHLQEKASLK